jgi:hypothetical protein
MAAPKGNMQKRQTANPVVLKKDEEQPRIAWHKLDIMTTLEIAEDQDDVGEIQVLAQALANNIATTEMVQRLLELRNPERQREKIKKQLALYAQYVEWLPQDWFVESAPTNLDFGNPETYKLLRSKRFGELYRLIAFGSQQAENAGKN